MVLISDCSYTTNNSSDLRAGPKKCHSNSCITMLQSRSLQDKLKSSLKLRRAYLEAFEHAVLLGQDLAPLQFKFKLKFEFEFKFAASISLASRH